jgi:hypothetical protein
MMHELEAKWGALFFCGVLIPTLAGIVSKDGPVSYHCGLFRLIEDVHNTFSPDY